MKGKYENGYLPKIHYWYGKLLKAATPLEQATALSKLNHFKKRHYEVYGMWVGVEELSYGVEPE